MAKKEKLLVGVDIGSHAVKVCQLQKVGDGYGLVALGSAVLPQGCVEDGVLQEPDQVGEVLTKLFKNLKFKKNTKVAISISGYSVIVKKIKLDVMDEDQLEKYLTDEAEQYIPFDIEDVYLDFQDLKTAPRRLGNPGVPVPFEPTLEENVLPTTEKIITAVREMMNA